MRLIENGFDGDDLCDDGDDLDSEEAEAQAEWEREMAAEDAYWEMRIDSRRNGDDDWDDGDQ